MASPVQTLAMPHMFEPYYSGGLRSRFKLDEMKQARAEKYAGTVASPVCTDYTYEANEERYLARASKRLAAGGLPTALPPGFPKRMNGPLAWEPEDLAGKENEFIYHLTNEDKVEIGAALEHFLELGLNGDDVQPSNFPLPNLSKQLHRICEEIYEGRGIAIIRGLDPDAYSDEDFAIVYLGITSYVGARRGKQDQRGSMLMHVLRRDQEDKTQSKDDFNTDKPFHTDTVCDCLCLVTKSCSAEGGRSVLASAWSVYNELAATRPDLIHTLAAPDWPFDTNGRHPAYYLRPVLYHTHENKLILNFSRRLLLGHPPNLPRSPSIPHVTEAQAEALDAIHFIARRLELHTTMCRGDIRLINNMAILHRRESFTDNAEQGQTRHLIRVWLNNEEMCWKLPRELRLAWARVFEDDERGEFWDIKPIKQNGVILRVAGSCD